jgi:hypothetical protein
VYLGDFDEPIQGEQQGGRAAGLEDELGVPHEHAALTVECSCEIVAMMSRYAHH